jgi:hypothetical protein
MYAHHSDVPPGIPVTHEPTVDVFSPGTEATNDALHRQSRLSALAAACAGAAGIRDKYLYDKPMDRPVRLPV